MEDLPTLQGPKNKTMGFEVISPSECLRDRQNKKRTFSKSVLDTVSVFHDVMLMCCSELKKKLLKDIPALK